MHFLCFQALFEHMFVFYPRQTFYTRVYINQLDADIFFILLPMKSCRNSPESRIFWQNCRISTWQRSIISHSLYTFCPLFEVQTCFFKGLFSCNSALMYSRAVSRWRAYGTIKIRCFQKIYVLEARLVPFY